MFGGEGVEEGVGMGWDGVIGRIGLGWVGGY